MLYDTYKNDLTDTLSRTTHADRLRSLGYGDDVAYCLQIDLIKALPVFDGGRLKVAD